MRDEYQNNIISSGAHFEAAGGPQREDTAAIIVYVKYVGDNHFTDTGIWDKRDGGEVDSEETTYNPGAMAERISLGGRVVPGNNTLSRLFRGSRDQDTLQKMFNAAGKSDVQIYEQPMDIDGNAYGRPIVWTGTLKRVTPPPRDSNSNNAALIEIEVTTTGTPTA